MFTSQLQTLSSAHFIGAQLSNRSSKQTACQRFSQEVWFSQEVKFMMISWTQTTRFDFTKQLHVNLQKPAFGFIQILLRRRKYILGSKNYFFGHKKLGFWTHTKLYLLTKNLFVWTEQLFLGHKNIFCDRRIILLDTSITYCKINCNLRIKQARLTCVQRASKPLARV